MADIKTHLRELSVATTVGLLKLNVEFDVNELYLDKDGVREKVSQNTYIQAAAPATPKTGDIWIEIEE